MIVLNGMILHRRFIRFRIYRYTLTLFLTKMKFDFSFPERGLREVTFDFGPITFGVLKHYLYGVWHDPHLVGGKRGDSTSMSFRKHCHHKILVVSS